MRGRVETRSGYSGQPGHVLPGSSGSDPADEKDGFLRMVRLLLFMYVCVYVAPELLLMC